MLVHGLIAAVGLHIDHPDDVSPPTYEVGGVDSLRFRQRLDRWSDAFSEEGDHLSVERVGLRQPANGSGEVADLAWVDRPWSKSWPPVTNQTASGKPGAVHDHFEGRSWTGLHRHALMTCIAYAYLQHLRLSEHRRTERGKNDGRLAGSAAVTQPARRAAGYSRTAVCRSDPARPMSTLSAMLQATV